MESAKKPLLVPTLDNRPFFNAPGEHTKATNTVQGRTVGNSSQNSTESPSLSDPRKAAGGETEAEPGKFSRIDGGEIHFKPFRPHFIFRGGHLQTLATQFLGGPRDASHDIQSLIAQTHKITLADGDKIVLHENCDAGWLPGDPCILIVHGLGGDHRTGYMLRLTERFTARGIRVFRVDMRGCGLGFDFAAGLNHAGRSSDVLAALRYIAKLSQHGPLGLIGVSLGGAQSLKMLAELDDGSLDAMLVRDRLQRAAIVAPPIDLEACSRNMERLGMRPYNRFFIRSLLGNIPTRVANSPRWKELDHRKLPKTMFELDERFTAPFSGFSGALDYYHRSAAIGHLPRIQTPTLIVAAKDDPIIPIKTILTAQWPKCIRLECIAGGGHVGFFQRGPQRYWMDERLEQWFSTEAFSVPPRTSESCSTTHGK